MKFKIGDFVKIDNYASNYHCLIGEIVDFDKESGLYIVDTTINKIGVLEKFLILNK